MNTFNACLNTWHYIYTQHKDRPKNFKNILFYTTRYNYCTLDPEVEGLKDTHKFDFNVSKCIIHIQSDTIRLYHPNQVQSYPEIVILSRCDRYTRRHWFVRTRNMCSGDGKVMELRMAGIKDLIERCFYFLPTFLLEILKYSWFFKAFLGSSWLS